jgi:hypothetical protein
MSKILIHIGQHKTGSTQLQALLNENSKILSDKLIDYLPGQQKKQIRIFLRDYINNKQLPLSKQVPIKSWFLNCKTKTFVNENSHNNAILSEEALFRINEHGDAFPSFDRYLANWYSDRKYLVVLREINAYTASALSQSIKGVTTFDYRGCEWRLEYFSLDRFMPGLRRGEIDLQVETFGNLIINDQGTENIASIIAQTFGVSGLKLKKIEGVHNKSLGAEGTALLLAYNNVMRMLLGEDDLAQSRREIAKSSLRFSVKINDQFPNQRKFFPYTKNQQTMYNAMQLARSQKFIKRFHGPWIDEIFTPVVNEQSISLISEFSDIERKTAVEMLEVHIKETLDNLSSKPKLESSFQLREAINFFVKNERSLVL